MKNDKVFNELFDDFILERLNKILVSKNLKSKKKENYDILYENFIKTLNEDQKNTFEQIISCLNSLNSDDLIIGYKTAVKDFYRMTN